MHRSADEVLSVPEGVPLGNLEVFLALERSSVVRLYLVNSAEGGGLASNENDGKTVVRCGAPSGRY